MNQYIAKVVGEQVVFLKCNLLGGGKLDIKTFEKWMDDKMKTGGIEIWWQ